MSWSVAEALRCCLRCTSGQPACPGQIAMQRQCRTLRRACLQEHSQCTVRAQPSALAAVARHPQRRLDPRRSAAAPSSQRSRPMVATAACSHCAMRQPMQSETRPARYTDYRQCLSFENAARALTLQDESVARSIDGWRQSQPDGPGGRRLQTKVRRPTTPWPLSSACSRTVPNMPGVT